MIPHAGLPADAGKPAREAFLREFLLATEARMLAFCETLDVDPVVSTRVFERAEAYVVAHGQLVDRTDGDRILDLPRDGQVLRLDLGARRLSNDSQILGVEVGVFMGECIRNAAMATYWALGRPPKRSVDYNQPVLASYLAPMEFGPFGIGQNMVYGVLAGTVRPDRMVDVCERWIATFRGVWSPKLPEP